MWAWHSTVYEHNRNDERSCSPYAIHSCEYIHILCGMVNCTVSLLFSNKKKYKECVTAMKCICGSEFYNAFFFLLSAGIFYINHLLNSFIPNIIRMKCSECRTIIYGFDVYVNNVYATVGLLVSAFYYTLQFDVLIEMVCLWLWNSILICSCLEHLIWSTKSLNFLLLSFVSSYTHTNKLFSV